MANEQNQLPQNQMVRRVYHVSGDPEGGVQTYTVDALEAVGRFPDEWSFTPWDAEGEPAEATGQHAGCAVLDPNRARTTVSDRFDLLVNVTRTFPYRSPQLGGSTAKACGSSAKVLRTADGYRGRRGRRGSPGGDHPPEAPPVALSRTSTAQPFTPTSLSGGGKAAELVQTNYEEMVTAALAEYPRKLHQDHRA